jgi:hypothetical protein
MTPIHSSHVDSIGHDAGTSVLYVKWDNGRTSAYKGVPAGLAEQVSKSWSVGKALASEVKGKFAHEYVS